MQRQVRAYFQEAKWLHHKQIPTIEEYMPVGLENAGSFLLIVMGFIGIQDFVTKDYLDWIVSDPVPKMVNAMSIVGRVMNDIAYHKVHLYHFQTIISIKFWSTTDLNYIEDVKLSKNKKNKK